MGLVLIFSSCSPYKMVPKNNYLLKQNKVSVEGTIKKPKIYQIEEQIRAKPNRKILGLVRFHLRAHSFGSSRKKPEKNDRKIRKFFREKVGEAPVIYDSMSTYRSVKNIRQLMFNKGYFNAKVAYTLDTGRWRRKVCVTYNIKPGEYSSIKRNDILTAEFETDSILDANKNQSLFKEGDQIDFDIISKERVRIDNLMKNNGYFYFGREFIEFDLDTQDGKVSIETVILSPDDFKIHRRVKLDSIHIVFPKLDAYKLRNKGQEKIEGVYFNMNGYPLKKEILLKRLTFNEGELYNKQATENTYTKLAELQLFKSIDIVHETSSKDSVNLINATIYLNPLKKQEYTIEPQGVISDDLQTLSQLQQNRSFGIGNALTYINRNILGSAEQFNLSSVTSFQAQIGSRANTIFEQSINARLNLPGSRIFRKLDHNPKVLNYSTQINLSYVFQRNPDYRRNILPANYSYLINKRKNNNWLLTPVEINFNRSTVNQNYLNQLTNDQKEFISIIFARNLLLSSHINYFTTKTSKRNPRKKWYINSNVLELGGNSLYALSSLFNAPKDTAGTYEVLGVPFSQYVRTDIDIRLTHDLDENNTFVYRINAGLALPYGNREFLPVDKRYFIGGANSLRGWNPRAMGPGNLPNTTNNISLNSTAEMLILGNLEYRFDVIGDNTEMALFFDAGNVWDIIEGTAIEQFRFNNFFQSTALNTGLGLRMDFQFFLLRLDWGIRMHNPSLPVGNRWVIQDFFKSGFVRNQTLLNIGLDYPF